MDQQVEHSRCQSQHPRTVLITGCSSGIGLAAAAAFARRGHQVFAGVRASSDRSALDALRGDGLPIHVVEADLADEASLRAAVSSVLEASGRLDVVVSNAGVGGGSTPVEDITDEMARSVLDTNVLGTLRLLRAALPPLRRQRAGTIVGVTSLSGRLPRPFIGLTSASKHALEALYEALAFEVAPFGLRVRLIEPGMFRSRIMDGETSRAQSASSAYTSWTAPLAERRARAMASAAAPDVVGEAIVRASSDTGNRLRYVVGAHAEAALAAREAADWEEWFSRVLKENDLHPPVMSKFGAAGGGSLHHLDA
jgi:NAD(P)-dependent dehydrogenase (short-subunit alcohol dehydrogenase family)